MELLKERELLKECEILMLRKLLTELEYKITGIETGTGMVKEMIIVKGTGMGIGTGI